MTVSLTGYWQQFVDRQVESGHYKNQSDVIRAGLRALQEREQAGELREFDQVFSGGRAGEPDDQTIKRAILRQKAVRKRRG